MSMNCREYREAHPSDLPEARAHRASCAECRAWDRTWELLREYPEIEPSARFLEGVRRKRTPRIVRFAAVVSAAAAVLLLAVVFTHHPAPSGGPPADLPTEVERQIVENWELLENFELLRVLDVVGESGSPLLEERR